MRCFAGRAIERAAQRARQLVDPVRLREQFHSATQFGAPGQGAARIARGERDAKLRSPGQRLACQCRPADAAAQYDVAEEQVDAGLAIEQRQRALRAGGFEHPVAELAQERGGDLAHLFVVLDDQDRLAAAVAGHVGLEVGTRERIAGVDREIQVDRRADSRRARDGRFIETIGYYNPQPDPSLVEVDEAKAKQWLECGAQPSDTVRKLLSLKGII